MAGTDRRRHGERLRFAWIGGKGGSWEGVLWVLLDGKPEPGSF